MKQTQKLTPPANTQRFMRWDQFPPGDKPETFDLRSPNGEIRRITLCKGTLRVFKALQNAPLLCASPVRISDRVSILKHHHGVTIRTEMFENDNVTARQKFGIYFLDDTVEPVADLEAA